MCQGTDEEVKGWLLGVFTPSTMWVLGIKLTLSGLAARAFTCWTASTVLLIILKTFLLFYLHVHLCMLYMYMCPKFGASLGCWSYKHAPPHGVSELLGIEHKASCMLGKHSTHRAMALVLWPQCERGGAQLWAICVASESIQGCPQRIKNKIWSLSSAGAPFHLL